METLRCLSLLGAKMKSEWLLKQSPDAGRTDISTCDTDLTVYQNCTFVLYRQIQRFHVLKRQCDPEPSMNKLRSIGKQGLLVYLSIGTALKEYILATFFKAKGHSNVQKRGINMTFESQTKSRLKKWETSREPDILSSVRVHV